MELFISNVEYVRNAGSGIFVQVIEKDTEPEKAEFMTKNNLNLFTENDSKFIVLGV